MVDLLQNAGRRIIELEAAVEGYRIARDSFKDLAAENAIAADRYARENATLRAERDQLASELREAREATEGVVRLLNLSANDRPKHERWTYTLTAKGELRVQMPPEAVAEPHAALSDPRPSPAKGDDHGA